MKRFHTGEVEYVFSVPVDVETEEGQDIHFAMIQLADELVKELGPDFWQASKIAYNVRKIGQ